MRLIIEYPDQLAAVDAIDIARVVVEQGKVSVSRSGVRHFCWATSLFHRCVSHRRHSCWMVYARPKKSSRSADSLLIIKETGRGCASESRRTTHESTAQSDR